jgi:hypothetical protein
MGLNRNNHDMNSLVTSAFERIVWILYSESAQVALIAPYEGSYMIQCYNSKSDALIGSLIYQVLADSPLADVTPRALSFDAAREFAKRNEECWGLALVDEERRLIDKHWVR